MNRLRYAVLVAALPALAQRQASPKLSFEAASVKPAEQVTGWMPLIKSSNPVHVTYRNYSLKRLIMEAYGVSHYQVQGPPWLGRDLYDIVANTPRGTTADQARLMMQSLLAERFHLALHTEKTEMSAYALLPGKGASKIRSEKDEPEVAGCKSFGTMSEYADMLSIILDRPVVNRTGLSGTYYFLLVVQPGLQPSVSGDQAHGDAPPPPPPAAPPPCPGWVTGKMPAPAPTVFEAVKEQMGLRLERREKVQVDLLVVDHADKTPEKN